MIGIFISWMDCPQTDSRDDSDGKLQVLGNIVSMPRDVNVSSELCPP